MDVINIGSLNLDWVYRVPHFVQPGETLQVLSFNEYIGGKGLNQSIALSRAGCKVAHVGTIGYNGKILVEALIQDGVNTDFIRTLSGPSGHVIIEIDPTGENSILVFPGTNQELTLDQIQQGIENFPEAKWVLLQNETNCVPEIMKLAKSAGKMICYNPAPMLPNVHEFPLELIDVLILNEIEGKTLNIDQINNPNLIVALTQGEKGVLLRANGQTQHYPAVPVKKVVDTTAAGDTFTGYFLAEYLRTQNIDRAVSLATQAASLCIQQPGAAQSIPKLDQDGKIA